MSIFENSKLYISARSPFARRVRIALREHKINYEEVVFNVFETNPQLNTANPLRRVPVIVLESGMEIVDSNQILKVFYDEQISSPLQAKDIRQKIVCANWSGIAVGVCELVVQYFLETQKEKALQDEALIREIREIIDEALNKYEKYLGEKEFCLGTQLTQTDIDWGVALFYLQLRMPIKLDVSFPKLNKYMNSLGQQESFKTTLPSAL
ncbi:MAG: glutathione S-transferase family protein [Oligoflexia bacterium]|nr:glutathione S-transferase family protein [Oligoflexia bacterium]